MANTVIAKPSSGQLPKVKGPEMNDRDRVNDIMTQQKYLSHGYNVGLYETQHPELRKTISQILQDVHDCQHRLFNLMFEKGWYKMKMADAAEIAQVHQQFSNYRTQFPSF
jgi:spore coat protein CotF